MTRIPLQQWDELAVTADYDCRKLAQLCDRSVRQLERRFHAFFGCPPQAWLNEQRIKAAQQLLLSGHPVKVVAFELGFKQPSHFCRQFKSQFQLTQSQFTAQAQNGFHVADR